MRVLVTGAAGFVGSAVVAVGADRGDEVAGLVRNAPPVPDPRCRYVEGDLLDEHATRALVRDAAPEVIVHTAILNDPAAALADRALAWDAYVGATRHLCDAANEVAAGLVYVSTDWVFDGTQAPADERTPPNPVNLYGFLKAASELVVLERARRPVVGRIAAVMGVHRARPALPRIQDAGFGYFAGSVVDALSSGRPFTVWESDSINMVATPSLASASAEWLLELGAEGLTGTFHCCGADGTTRFDLALLVAEVFGLDPGLLLAGPPEPGEVPAMPIPYDTRLDARATAAALGKPLPSLRKLLERFRAEYEAYVAGPAERA